MHFNHPVRWSRLLPLVLIALAPACAAPPVDYPSLAIRDVERVTGSAMPVASAPYVPPPTPTGVIDQVAQLQASASAADAAFRAEEARSRGTLTGLRGAEQGTDRWAAGLAALADLEGLRGTTMVVLADLDRLFVDAAVEGGDTAQIGAARDAVAALVDGQNAALAGFAN
jgi:hypothetical protein